MGATMRLALVTVVGAFALVMLTACVGSGLGFAALDRAEAPGDALPTDLPDYAYDDIVRSSSRFLVEHDGNRLYLVKAEETDRVCLLIYPDSTDWVLGCGGAPEFGVGGTTGSYVVRADAPASAPAPAGHSRKIAPNLFTDQ
ncbi:hypothetical protein [Agromyces sp. NPDC056965]|uniref:hypothetical protein n=1 Tax=Agromyces sp. NPDC056965 TaxID=3345983 RepID=UPI00362F36FB